MATSALAPAAGPDARFWCEVLGRRYFGELPVRPARPATCYHCEPLEELRRWMHPAWRCLPCRINNVTREKPAYSHERIETALRFYQDRQDGVLTGARDVQRIIEKADLELAIQALAGQVDADGQPVISDLELEVLVLHLIQGLGVVKIAAALDKDRTTIWRTRAAAGKKLYKWLNFKSYEHQE